MRGTVGEEFKEAAQADILALAKAALTLHTAFEGRAITNAKDVEAFQRDLEVLDRDLRDIRTNAIRCWIYYDQGGTK